MTDPAAQVQHPPAAHVSEQAKAGGGVSVQVARLHRLHFDGASECIPEVALSCLLALRAIASESSLHGHLPFGSSSNTPVEKELPGCDGPPSSKEARLQV